MKKALAFVKSTALDLLLASGSATLSTAILAVFFFGVKSAEEIEGKAVPIAAAFGVVWATATLSAWLRDTLPMRPHYIVLNADVTVDRDSGISIRYPVREDHKTFDKKEDE